MIYTFIRRSAASTLPVLGLIAAVVLTGASLFLTSGFLAKQATEFTLIIQVPDGSGSSSPEVGAQTYAELKVVLVKATPDSGWQFDHWIMDGASSSSNPIKVTMDAAHTLKAVFAQTPTPPPTTYTLTIQSPSGSGSTNPDVGNYSYPSGATFEVLANPASGWQFDHWALDDMNIGSMNLIVVTVDSNYTLNAVFIPSTDEISFKVYADPACTNILSDLTLGTLTPGETLVKTIYIKNEGNVAATFTCSFTDWTPSEAVNYFTVSIDIERTILDVGQMIPAKVYLYVHPDIPEIDNFSFKLSVNGTT